MTTIQVKSFTLEEYHELIEIGFLKEDDHISRSHTPYGNEF